MIKVAFFHLKPTGCGFIRQLQPFSILESVGLIEFQYIDFREEPREQVEKLLWCDIFALAREWIPNVFPLLEIAKKNNKKIVCDFDDDIFGVPETNPAARLYARQDVKESIKNVISFCDLITVTQEELRQKFLSLKKNVKIIPNFIIPDFFKKINQVNSDFRVGWAGSCYDSETECFTKNGWKLFKDLKPSEEVLTLNSSTGIIEYQKIKEVYSYEYNGKMLRIKSKKADLLVTPNHKLFVSFGDKEIGHSRFQLVEAENVFGKNFLCKNNGKWKGLEDDGSKFEFALELVEIKKEDQEWVNYYGNVYCIEVPNHIIYVRRNGLSLWCGNSTHYVDLKLIFNIIKPLLDEFKNLTFIFIGYIPEEIANVSNERIFFIPPVSNPILYYSNLAFANFDIAIAPLANIKFNKYKSNLKILEFGALRYPVICSNVFEYSKFIKHKQNGLFATKYSEWISRIRYLYNDEVERFKLGTNLFETVKNFCDIRKNIYIWASVFYELLGKQAPNIPEKIDIDKIYSIIEKNSWWAKIPNLEDYRISIRNFKAINMEKILGLG